jgi:16S rRNA (guanine527-N7)-methyltransferase
MLETVGEIVRRGANDVWKLGLSEAQIEQFEQFAALIIEWNATRMNLTRLTSPREIAVKHFLDSLALLTVVVVPENSRVIDVGTGPGLPGLALKIVRPDLRVTLLDSTAKKLLFCRAAADALGFADVKTVHARAEDVAKIPDLVGQFDCAVARAVAPLDRLLPWLAPFARPGGMVIALKGTHVADEMAAARLVARRLGLTLTPPISVTLPEAEEPTVRQIVVGRR